jgi:hypothetical protein
VSEGFKVQFGSKSIQIRTTDQRLSGHAGQSTFWAFFHRVKFREALARGLPHRPTSPNATKPEEIALGFLAGVLAGADKLARVAWLRADPVLPTMLDVRRIVSQSTLTRFFQGFGAAAVNLRCFDPLWQWCLDRLPSRKEGYTLDMDSTAIISKSQGRQTLRLGIPKPHRLWWNTLWEKILSPFPNCNAVGQNPPPFGSFSSSTALLRLRACPKAIFSHGWTRIITDKERRCLGNPCLKAWPLLRIRCSIRVHPWLNCCFR